MLTWALLFASGCQGGYPIPASQCDEWCDAAQIPCVEHWDNSPAQCVRDCVSHGGDASACQPEHDAAVACLHDSSKVELECSTVRAQGLGRVCDDEQTAYEACAAVDAYSPHWYD